MKLKKTLALGLVAAMAASFTACGSTAAESAADSTASGEAAAEAAADAPDGDGDPTTLTVAMECAYAPYNWTQSDDSNGAVANPRLPASYAYGYDVMMAKKLAEALGAERGDRQARTGTAWSPPFSARRRWTASSPASPSRPSALPQVDFSEPVLLRLHHHPDQGRIRPVCFRRQRGGPGRRHRYQPAGHHLVRQLPAPDPRWQHPARPGGLRRLHAGGPEQRRLRHRGDRPCPPAWRPCVAYPDFTLLDFGGTATGAFEVSAMRTSTSGSP